MKVGLARADDLGGCGRGHKHGRPDERILGELREPGY